MQKWPLAALIAVLSWTSTRADEGRTAIQNSDSAPRFIPVPQEVLSPPDNRTTPTKVELGKQLFFDPRLSGDNTTSCATCHLAEKGFGDGLARSKGAGGKELARNTPTLLNVGFHTSFFWDGRAASLEEQALGPIQSPDEMNQDLGELERELAAVPGYVARFFDVFGRRITRVEIAKALAAFQRTLVTRNSPFDRFLAGDKNALSLRAREGFELFKSEAGCARCHHGLLLSDGKFYRLGIGRDVGREKVTGRKEDRFKFRTPSLRDIALTGPYMHDGTEESLFDVVEFYYRRAPSRLPDDLELDIEPLLGQSYSDIDAIVEFLKSLTGEPLAIERPELP